MTFTQDSKATSTLSAASRTAAASITQGTKVTGGMLWSSAIFPWVSTFFPWLWVGSGVALTQDARH